MFVTYYAEGSYAHCTACGLTGQLFRVKGKQKHLKVHRASTALWHWLRVCRHNFCTLPLVNDVIRPFSIAPSPGHPTRVGFLNGALGYTNIRAMRTVLRGLSIRHTADSTLPAATTPVLVMPMGLYPGDLSGLCLVSGDHCIRVVFDKVDKDALRCYFMSPEATQWAAYTSLVEGLEAGCMWGAVGDAVNIVCDVKSPG